MTCPSYLPAMEKDVPRHSAETSSIRLTYLERLHAHLVLTGTLRESLLELLSRPDAPLPLQHWITTILDQNREQERQVAHLIRTHGEKPRNGSDTLSGLLDTVVTCFPSGDVPTHLLGVMLDIAGYIARLRTSLALLLLLAEKLSLTTDATILTELRQNSKNASRSLKEVLPALLTDER
ncbi:DUF892 family protein [Bombella sp. TMW 2.2543]|uniref:DUF892 family protein n=1 Tax=Bombella pluederhausensis TaxID=2967336 RepID=A0ABT3WHN8_9PROT|nr:DUF892 family protein [Bombella pluederhausensis]MCX5618398.1 DUF892 family protein [Bombella pluederhausensis]